MRYQVLSHLPFAICTRTPPTPWASAWGWARDAVHGMVAEAALYARGSPRSRLHGQAALRELDARLRRDIGLVASAPDAVPSVTGLKGHR